MAVLEAVEPLEELVEEAVALEAVEVEVELELEAAEAAVSEAEAELVSEGEAVAGSLGAVVQAFPVEVADLLPI